MKFNFLPKEDSFFQQFERQASFDRDAGAMLLNLMEDFDNMGAHLEALNELELQIEKQKNVDKTHNKLHRTLSKFTKEEIENYLKEL